MKTLAKEWNQETRLWELVGLLHDIDWDETRYNKDKHGVIAGEYLKDKLPEKAIHAIMSHDYRTGIRPLSKLDNALVFADSLAHIFSNMRNIRFDYQLFKQALKDTTEKGRPWMKEIINNYIASNEIPPSLIEQIYNNVLELNV